MRSDDELIRIQAAGIVRAATGSEIARLAGEVMDARAETAEAQRAAKDMLTAMLNFVNEVDELIGSKAFDTKSFKGPYARLEAAGVALRDRIIR